jgi:hypothetical protein
MATSNPALIRLVTAHYHDMQGLRTMADAALPFGMGLLLSIGMYASELTHSLWALLVAFIPLGWWIWARHTWVRRRIDAFYADRCGRVGGFVSYVDHVGAFTMAVISLPLLVQVAAPLWLRVAIVLPFLVVPPLWTVVRDSPHRTYWFLPALVGFIAALRLVDARSYDQAVMWQMWVSVAGGLAIACAGALDHRVLLQTLHAAGGPADSTEQVPS